MMKYPKYDYFKFPCGEDHVRITDLNNYHDREGSKCVDVCFDFPKQSVMELLLLNSAIKNAGAYINRLYIPYLPFSRQDRVCSPGDSFSLRVMMDLINSIEANEVIVEDPHSDVCKDIYGLKIIEQHTIFQPLFIGRPTNSYILVSPDKGARTKTEKLALANKQDKILVCSKVRNPVDGKLSGFEVNGWKEDYLGLDLIIADDLCDGGGTFIGIGKKLKELSPRSKIILMVTHGFFTKCTCDFSEKMLAGKCLCKGLRVFDGIIDEVYTRHGKVK